MGTVTIRPYKYLISKRTENPLIDSYLTLVMTKTVFVLLVLATGTMFILVWNHRQRYTSLIFATTDADISVNISYLVQYDPLLVSIVRKQILIPPSNDSTRFLKYPNVIDPSAGQSKIIREILQNKTKGFFVECGALDGETQSNTLYLERYLDWSGLLIEADSNNFEELSSTHRKAWMANVCVSLGIYPVTTTFFSSKQISRILRSGENHTEVNTTQCIPFLTLMLALNQSHIDYFSLDVEGDELKILKTIPFDSLDIQTLSVEFTHVPEGQQAILKFMKQNGYRMHSYAPLVNDFHSDFIFVKESKAKG